MALIRPLNELALGYGPRGARYSHPAVKSNSRDLSRFNGGFYRSLICVHRVSSNLSALTHSVIAHAHEGVCLLVSL